MSVIELDYGWIVNELAGDFVRRSEVSNGVSIRKSLSHCRGSCRRLEKRSWEGGGGSLEMTPL